MASTYLMIMRALLLAIATISLPDLLHLASAQQTGITSHYKFNIKMANVTRLCAIKRIITVNGQFLGPKIVAREGDRVIITVVNHVNNNVTIHWHGVWQLRSAWADGPAYVTLFFTVAGHSLKVVDADAVYVKPFDTDVLLISPGQTTNVLLHAKPNVPNATFLMAARPYVTGQGTFDNSTVVGILEYKSSNAISATKQPLVKPSLPSINDTKFATNFARKIKSLANAQYPSNVPHTVDHQFFFTAGLGTSPCTRNQTCQGPNDTKFAATVNNVSFTLPTTALLQSHFFGQSKRVYASNFLVYPLHPFNYTGTPPNNTLVEHGTKVSVLPFNASVELIMQDMLCHQLYFN